MGFIFPQHSVTNVIINYLLHKESMCVLFTERSHRQVATVPIKKVIQHSPSLTSPTATVSPSDGEVFLDNNNDEEEILPVVRQAYNMAATDIQV